MTTALETRNRTELTASMDIDWGRAATDAEYRNQEVASALMDHLLGNIVALARIVAMNDEDGIPQPIPNNALLDALRRVANGQCDEDVVRQYFGQSTKLRLFSTYSEPDQQRVTSDQPFDVVEVNNGNTDVLKVKIENMTARQFRQVFGQHGIRDVAAQRAWLADVHTEKSFQKSSKDAQIKVDKKKGEIFVTGPRRITKRELLDYVAEL